MHNRFKNLAWIILAAGLGLALYGSLQFSGHPVTEGASAAGAGAAGQASGQSLAPGSSGDISGENPAGLSTSAPDEETGATSDSLSGSSSESVSASASGEELAEGAASGKDPVLNILCWNNELRELMKACYPAYEERGEDSGAIGETEVRWISVQQDENAYYKELKASLEKNTSVPAEERIDLFLVGPGEAKEMAVSGAAIPLDRLGIREEELADQFDYARDIITDAEGRQCGSSWQSCPGVMIYRRDIAERVLGSADPDEVQKAVSNWENFAATAKKMKEAGIRMTATVYDTFRPAMGGAASGWVNDSGIDANATAKAWAESAKENLKDGLAGAGEMWGESWYAGLYTEGDIFCYFGPEWMIRNDMNAAGERAVSSTGGWAVCEGPQSFFWSGVWICVAEGSDDTELAADVIRTLTTDAELLTRLVREHGECVNSRTAMELAGRNRNLKSDVLGGQNPFPVYLASAEKAVAPTGPYDEICAESFQSAMMLYFEEILSYDEAVSTFRDLARESIEQL